MRGFDRLGNCPQGTFFMTGFPVIAVRERLVSFENDHAMKCSSRVLWSRRILAAVVVVLLAFLTCDHAAAQQGDNSQSESAVCTFEDGKQMSIRYAAVPAGHGDFSFGKVWTPGGSALTLFTETDVTLNGKVLPVGAYTMYLIPGKKTWTTIVSRNTAVTAKYDEKNDLARASMETGELGQAEPGLKVFFGHTGAKTCEFNVDYGKTRAWVEFKER
jgi:Protein of unknown function (DUF2911)